METSNKKIQEVRDELSVEPAVQPIYDVSEEIVVVEEHPLVTISTTLGDSWIAGSSTNAIVGTWTGTENGGQLVVGASNNDETLVEVVLPNNIFYERFNVVADVKSGLYYTAYTHFNTSTTTATLSAANQNATMTDAEVIKSKTIKLDGEIIDTVIATWIADADVVFEVSANGGSNWETLTLNTSYTIVTAGAANNELQYRVTYNTDLPSTIQGHWKFNGDSTDTGTGGNDGTDTSIVYVTGKIGKAAQFNGTTSKIVIGDVHDVGSSDFSYSVWVYPTESGSTDYILSKGQHTGAYSYALHMRSDKALVATTTTAGTLTSSHISTDLLTLNAWNHVVWTKTGTTSRLYINGTEDSGGAGTLDATVYDSAGDLAFGARDTSGTYGFFWVGLMDDMRYYSSVLSTNAITEIYNSGSGTESSGTCTISDIVIKVNK